MNFHLGSSAYWCKAGTGSQRWGLFQLSQDLDYNPPTPQGAAHAPSSLLSYLWGWGSDAPFSGQVTEAAKDGAGHPGTVLAPRVLVLDQDFLHA